MTRPRTTQHWLLLILFAGAPLLLAGCGSDPYPGEDPNTLHVFVASAIKGLDPALAQDETSNICVLNLYDQLYEYEYLTRPYQLKPSLAEAMPEISEDTLTYTIRMKKGIRFIDDPCFEGGKGREVNAHDMVFCFKRMMDSQTKSTGTWIFDGKIVGLDEFRTASGKVTPKNPSRDSYPIEDGYPEVAGIKALDDFTIQFKLKEPYPQFIWTLAMGYMSVYPREAVKHYGKEFLYSGVTTGPYQLESVNLHKKIIFKRNPNYREDRFPKTGMPGDAEKRRLTDAGKALPICDRVVLTVFKESQPQWLYFMRGYLDRTGIPKDNFDGAVDQDTFELLPPMVERGITLDKDPKMEVIYDCFNMEDEVVGSPAGAKGLAIRRAISLVTDNAWAIKHLYNGRAERVDGPILKEFPEFDSAYRNPWKRGMDESREAVVARAKKILADAGYPGGKGVPELTKDIVDSDVSRTFFLAFQRDLREIGLRCEANAVSWPEFLSRLNTRKAQIWGVSWGADYPDPQNFFQLFYGPNAAPGVNKSCYDNPEFNDLYEKTRVMLASDERTRLYRRMQEIVAEQVVWSFRCRRVNFNLIHPWLSGYRYNDMGQKYFKYAGVNPDQRLVGVKKVNKATVWPLLVFLALFALLVGATLVAARRRTTGW